MISTRSDWSAITRSMSLYESGCSSSNAPALSWFQTFPVIAASSDSSVSSLREVNPIIEFQKTVRTRSEGTEKICMPPVCGCGGWAAGSVVCVGGSERVCGLVACVCVVPGSLTRRRCWLLALLCVWEGNVYTTLRCPLRPVSYDAGVAVPVPSTSWPSRDRAASNLAVTAASSTTA